MKCFSISLSKIQDSFFQTDQNFARNWFVVLSMSYAGKNAYSEALRAGPMWGPGDHQVIETQTFSVLVSSLRLTSFQSRFRDWDSDIFSLSLGLVIVIETQTISVSVSSLRLRHFSFGPSLDDPNLVLLIPGSSEPIFKSCFFNSSLFCLKPISPHANTIHF